MPLSGIPHHVVSQTCGDRIHPCWTILTSAPFAFAHRITRSSSTPSTSSICRVSCRIRKTSSAMPLSEIPPSCRRWSSSSIPCLTSSGLLHACGSEHGSETGCKIPQHTVAYSQHMPVCWRAQLNTLWHIRSTCQYAGILRAPFAACVRHLQHACAICSTLAG